MTRRTAIDIVTFPSLSVAAAPSSPQAHTTIALEQTRKVTDYFVMCLASFPLVSLLAGNVSASYPSTVRPEDVSGMKLRVCETQVWEEG